MSKLSETERQELYQAIPFGRQSFYQSFREAGIHGARPLRNIPWILTADDGTPIFCLWRKYLRASRYGVAAKMDVRTWTGAKARQVQAQLEQSVGKRIRIVVVEDGQPGSKTARSTSFDPMMWQVEESRGDFLLTRTDARAHRPGTVDEFTQRMLDLYDDAKAELNYKASRLLQAVRTDGGVAAAKTWLAKNSNPTEGFERLYRENRLDLSVEAIVLNPRWSGLFSPSELEPARARLEEYGYFLPVRKAVQHPEKLSPDEIDPKEEFPEGLKLRVEVNSYERDPKARSICIGHYGAKCIVCRFDFGKRFGKIGSGYIHVHHLNPVSMLGSSAKTDPIRDLRPVLLMAVKNRLFLAMARTSPR